jgi:sulfatase modifying factor 1
MARFTNLFVVFAFVLAMSSEACSTPIEFSQGGMAFVEVGDLGNVSSTSGYGAVAYSFGMGRHEVTINQYCEFLNAVAKSDPYGLYDTRMATNLNVAGISRSGSSGAYAYAVMDNAGYSGNRPISYVGAYSAMRFTNWMSNGKGSGSTESGAYYLQGQINGALPDRTPDAGFYIPTDDEWYKAAYYSPTLNGDAGGYYSRPTQSNAIPGNSVGESPNQANILVAVDFFWTASVTQSSNYDPNQNYLTDAGAFSASASYYGTLDQHGNVREWTFLPGTGNAIVRDSDWHTPAWFESGGSFVNFSNSSNTPGPGGGMDDDGYVNNFSSATSALGFRLAYIQPVPEPSSIVLAGVGVCIGIVWHFRRRGVA